MVDVLGIPLSLLLLLVGAGLMFAEAMAPGAHFVVVGAALTAAGAVGLLASSVIGGPLLVLLMAAVVLLAGGATLAGYRKIGIGSGGANSKTSDSNSLRGQSGRVTERVTTEDGEVKLEKGGFNPYYQARSMDDDIETGTEIIVLDPGGGNVLTVAPATAVTEDAIDRELREHAASGSETGGDQRSRDGDVESA